jgi:Holliday junction resolvase RusA-like endonuclease
MDTINFTIPGNPITKKNSQMIGRAAGGRPFIMPSKRFRQYEKEAKLHINYTGEPISTPVNVKVVYYMQTRRRVDLTNLLEATDDILVECGVLADDNYRIVSGHDGSRVLFDKENPRAEITIEEAHWTQVLWDLYGVEKEA